MDCPFISCSKWWTQISTAVKMWDRVNMPTTQKTWFFSWFCAWLRGSKECILQTLPNIRNYEWPTPPLLTARMNTSWQVWHTVPCSGFSTWQHFRTDSWQGSLSEVNHRAPLFLFRKPSLFSPSDLSASVNDSICINKANTFVDACHWFFIGNKKFCNSKLFATHITDQLHLRQRCTGAVWTFTTL